MTKNPPTTEIPVQRPKDLTPVVAHESTPIYDALVEELGHDPLDLQHPSHDEYYAASQLYLEAKTELDKLCTITARRDVDELAREAGFLPENFGR